MSNFASSTRTEACIGSRPTDRSRAEPQRLLRGAIYEITTRKALEVRLLALNETLEARVTELRQEARNLEILNETGVAVAAERDLTTLVQTVTDAGVQLSHAEFGAFFYNVMREDGEAYTLYTLSGVPREAFAKFPMPRNTAIFEPTFRGRGPLRSDDILADPRYGKNAPHKGMPEGHLPVRSYLAVSVVSRSGEVLGGLFFGHSQPRVFTDAGRTDRFTGLQPRRLLRSIMRAFIRPISRKLNPAAEQNRSFNSRTKRLNSGRNSAPRARRQSDET